MRDTKTNKINLEHFSCPEFDYLQDNTWVFTEKVDGTNIRIMFDEEGKMTIGGRTDNAQIPTQLYQVLVDMFAGASYKNLILFGEGYGPKIQNGGKYRKDLSFVLFDVAVGNWWLRRTDVETIAQECNIDVVPIIGYGTIENMVNACKEGFSSTWGAFEAEGIVARPQVELKARNGSRIITKLKCRDFK